MKNYKILFLIIVLASFFSTQVQASFSVAANNSKVEVSGSVNDFISDAHDGYQDGAVYSSTAIPFNVTQNPLFEGEASIDNATAFSNAELNFNITQTANGYSIMGNASSYADTEMNSLDDNEATALAEAVVDMAFTLTSDYNFAFTSSLFDAEGTGESEAELISNAGGIIFSQIVTEDALDLSLSGFLAAGNYTLFIGALSEAFDGDFASADLAYNLELTSVPLPAGLTLFLSGLVALGFKNRINRKAEV